MSESPSPPSGESFDDFRNRIIQIGCDLYKQTVPIHSVNVNKPKSSLGKIAVSTASVRAALKEQYPSISFISIESWPMTFKIYLKNDEQVNFLAKKRLDLCGQSCYIYVQEPIIGAVVHVSQIPSLWNSENVKKFFSEFGNVTSATKNDANDGALETSATVVFEKAPAFMVEYSTIKISESFPAIRWRFGSKTTCPNCSTVGHYASQCPYPVDNIPSSLVKKNTQAAKNKAAAAKRTANKEAVQEFEKEKDMEKKLFEVTEEFQPVQKSARGRPPTPARSAPTVNANADAANNFYSKLDADNSGTDKLPINTSKSEGTENDTSSTKTAPTSEPAKDSHQSAAKLPAKAKPNTPDRNVATKTSKDAVNKTFHLKTLSQKSDNTIVSSLNTRSRSTSTPTVVSPENKEKTTAKSNSTSRQ